MENRGIDVSRLIDEQKIGQFTIRLVVLSFLIMLADGYDLLTASYGAPALIASWHLKPAELGPVFSASPFGMSQRGERLACPRRKRRPSVTITPQETARIVRSRVAAGASRALSLWNSTQSVRRPLPAFRNTAKSLQSLLPRWTWLGPAP